MVEVWPACLVAGLFFAVPQFLVSNYMGPALVDIIAAMVSIGATYVLLRFWQPKKIWRFEGEADHVATAETTPSTAAAWKAWMPWLILSVLVFAWGYPTIKNTLNKYGQPVQPAIEVPYLHNLVLKAEPIVHKPTPEAAKFTFNWISATGTALLLTGIFAGLLLGLSAKQLLEYYLHTLKRVRFSLLTIAAMLALGFTTRYSGSDATMGLAFAATGSLFPFFSPMLGWLGVALTGSDTSSNVLFGNLQKVSAAAAGAEPDPHRGVEQLGRSDGQDDRRPEHRGRRRGHQAGRPRRGNPALRLLAQPGARRPGGRPGDAPGLRLPGHDPEVRSTPWLSTS